jgi:hypothetical protein
MLGMRNLKFANTQQATAPHDYKNTKEKFYKTNAAIWFNKICKIVFNTWIVMLGMCSFVLVDFMRMAVWCQTFKSWYSSLIYGLYFIFYWIHFLLDVLNIRSCTVPVTKGNTFNSTVICLMNMCLGWEGDYWCVTKNTEFIIHSPMYISFWICHVLIIIVKIFFVLLDIFLCP